jgi:DNA-binding CsgD family transcriptional regulator
MHAGSGQVILISGEAGVGKSRLVAEAGAYAAAQQVTIFNGHCYQEDSATPYAPIIDLLHPFFARHSVPSLPTPLQPVARELLHLLPDAGPIITPDAGFMAPHEPEQIKRRLFMLVSQFLIHQTATTPLLVVIEDLHWSDEASIEFCLYLARRCTAFPLVLLLTYRDDEHRPDLAWLAQFDRERLAQELHLSPLTPSGVAAMIGAIFTLNLSVRAEFLDMMYALTEGNPFFVEEVLKSLIVTGDIYRTSEGWDRKPIGELRVPRSIHGAVQQRTKQLSAAANHVLGLAAVAGRSFNFGLLKDVTQYTDQALLDLLKELIIAQFVVEESVDRFVFRHALTRQAIYTTLLARERKALHQTLAEAIERCGCGVAALETHLAELAHHFYEADIWAKALEYSVRAGKRAQMLYAPRAARDHLTRAVYAAQQLSLTPSAAIYQARGQAYEILGDFTHARTDFEMALHVTRAADDRQMEWTTLLDLGKLWVSRDYTQAGTYFRDGLRLARELGNSATLAYSLNRVGNWHLNIEQPLEARQCHTEALHIFESLNDQRGVAETLDLLGMARYLGGDLIGGTASYERAVTLFRELNDRQGLASSLATLTMRGGAYQTSTMLAASRDVPEAAHEGEAALIIARDIGWRAGEAYALIFLGFCLGGHGDYSRALELVHDALAIGEEIEHRQWITAAYCAFGALHLDMLSLGEAQRYLDHALTLAHAIGSAHWVRCTAGYLASTYVLQHEYTKAEALLNSVLEPTITVQTLGQRLAWSAYAELALAQNDPRLALDIVDRLFTTAVPIGHETQQTIPRLAYLRGNALAALSIHTCDAGSRLQEAEASYQAGLQTATSHKAYPLVWRLQVALGNLYRVQGRHVAAEQTTAAARSTIEALAAQIRNDALRNTFLRRAFALLPPTQRHAQRRVTQRPIAGLTRREWEVAAHVAQGKTNREIAAELVVSERTIETHISHILAKLGFATRRQITSWFDEQRVLNNG